MNRYAGVRDPYPGWPWVLAAEANETAASPSTRPLAAQLIALVRVPPHLRFGISWPPSAPPGPPQREALKRMIEDAARQLERRVG